LSCQAFILHYRRFKISTIFLPYSISSLVPHGEKKFDEVNLGFMFLGSGRDQNGRFQLQSVASLQLLSLYLFTKNGNKIQGQKAS